MLEDNDKELICLHEKWCEGVVNEWYESISAWMAV